jgi:hypothetical protein
VAVGLGEVEFGEDVADVFGHCGVADFERSGDGGVVVAFGHLPEYLPFPGGQPVEWVGRACAVEQLPYHVGVDDGLAGGDPRHRVGEVGDFADAVFEQVADSGLPGRAEQFSGV